MKKVTSWAAIIAVPTAITGFYGQNLPYPGFNHQSGFITSSGAIVVVSALLYLVFKVLLDRRPRPRRHIVVCSDACGSGSFVPSPSASPRHTWAAGDITGGPQFTHLAWNDYRIIKRNLAGGNVSTRGRLVPYTVFVTPEPARVGLSEQQARAAGHTIRVASIPVAVIPRARTLRDTTGVWKAVVDAETDLILGATLLGPEASEAITTVQTAMLGGLPYPAVRDMIINHPTMTEGLNILFDTV